MNVENIQGSSKIKLEWEKKGEIPKSLTFTILLQDTSGKLKDADFTYVTQDESSRYSQTLNVEQFIRYRIKIKSCVHHICGEYSDPKLITTEEGAPSAVENLSLVNRLDGVQISWSRPKDVPGIIRKYILNFKRIDINVNANGYPKVLDNTTTNHTIIDLPPYQDLVAEVTPYTVVAGPPVTKRFRSPQGTPGRPLNLSVILLTDVTISIKWAEPEYPNGVILGYGVSGLFMRD